MIFIETELKGSYIVQIEPNEDVRGFFARIFDINEFKNYGINFDIVQMSISYNKCKGTLRGMHYQTAPKTEAKIVRCTRGAIYDVIIDLRSDSPTYCKWVAMELTTDNHLMIYIPSGFAHGFQTLEDDTEVFYQMNEFYSSEYAQGVRWNDPAFGIEWPESERIISINDMKYTNYIKI